MNGRPRHKPTSRAGAFLRELREAAGMTTDDVRRVAGFSLQTAYNVERGTTKSPETCEAFARACDATPEQLDRLRVLVARDRGVIDVPRWISDSELQTVTRFLHHVGQARR